MSILSLQSALIEYTFDNTMGRDATFYIHIRHCVHIILVMFNMWLYNEKY